MKKRLISLLLAVILCLSLSVNAFAETIENKDNTITEINTTTSDPITDPETGNITVTVTITEKTDGTTHDGVTVDKDVTKTETTVTDADGSIIAEKHTEVGSEKLTWEEADDGSNPGQKEVIVELKPGTSTVGKAEETVTNGSVPTSPEDQNYHYVESKTTERTVTAETSEIVITEKNSAGQMQSPVVPVTERVETDDLDSRYGGDIPSELEVTGTAPEGYPYQIVGSGQQSWQYISRIYVIYEKDEETGEPRKDDDGNYIIKELRKITSKANEILTVDGVPTTDISAPFDQKTGTTAAQGFMMDENGSFITVYCCDLGVSSYEGDWYAIENLEDADYYASEDAEKHVRNIVTNGYWGTEDGKGSLSQIKEKMKNALAAGEIDSEIEITYQNSNGENVTETVILTDAIIDAMTSGEALDMTQAAIWSYSNGAQGVQDGKDGYVVGNVVYGDTYRGRQKTGSDDPEGMARMTAMYNWLLELDEDITSTTVINEDNFVKDLTLTVGDKAADKGGNSDVYNADLNFKMEFKPSDINDDLLLHITYTDAYGESQRVIKRIAGSAENDNLGVEYLRPNDDGVYKIEGLKLSENEAFDFELHLEGKQYLDDGVYLFVAEKDNSTHQTLVGMTQGSHTVDISAKVSIEFNVDETDRYSRERYWSRTWDPNYEIPEENPPKQDPPPEEEIPDENPPLNDIPDEDTPLVDIFEEEVPLANVPNTGDNSVVFAVLAVLSVMGLAVLSFPKKRVR